MIKDQTLFHYLNRTLGITYLPVASPEPVPVAESSIAELIPHPGFAPELIFLNYDPQDVQLSPPHLELFEKIVKALDLEPGQVWRVQGGSFHFSDVLNRLRALKIFSPIVVMKLDPEIFDRAQQTGPHTWAECFSVSRMAESPQLKKSTWKVLQYFIKKG